MRIQLTSNAAQILRQLKTLPARMAAALIKVLDLQNELTIARSKRSYLSGPRPKKLGVVTNRLRSSITRAPARQEGQTILSSIGTNVVYAGVHEHGFNGKVQVAAFTRRNPRGNITVPGGQTEVSLKTGRLRRTKAVQVASGISTVRAHTRTMRMPARPFLRPAAEDRAAIYGRKLSEAIVNTWAGEAAR